MGASSSTSAGVGVGVGVGIPEGLLDFSFGFDNAAYSDRTLLLEIVDHDYTNTTAPWVKTIHIDSLILAARSPFFLKLFSNGMLESAQKVITLRIQTSEEVSFMDLLKYIYSNNLPTTRHALLDLLVLADKFEVASCMRDCTQLLISMPMTCESTNLYLDLSPSLMMSPTVQPLINAAKQFLIAHFCDFDKRKEEILDLSLAGMQVVLSCDDLQVTSEDVVYDSVLKWVHKHYKHLEERREILKTHLLDLIRFPFMTIPQLTEEVQICSDFDPKLASKIVTRALCFKAETPHRKRCLAKEEEGNVISRQFIARAYIQPIKVVELESPDQYCIVFLHITKKELTRIFPDGQIISETFHLGTQELVLNGKCHLDNKTNAYFFGLNLKLVGSTTSFPVKYEVAVRKKPSEEFVKWKGGNHMFSEHVKVGQVVSVWWTELTGDENTYFINDVMHLRAELTTKI